MAEVRKKLAIIDGKSVFYRGYYALPGLSTNTGIPTGGVFGFTAMALELINQLKPDYVAVAWDKPKTSIRKRLEVYPEYKAGRKPPPPDFYAQIPILHELLEAFCWPLYELDDYEADDIMGALAVQAKDKNVETMLITSDLDMLQLVNSHTHVYALKKGFSNIELYHPESFEQKYGIRVNQFLDLKSLKGDSSDNIPGVPGIGEKTALELLKQYGTLDGIYKNLDLIKETLRAKLVAGKESAYLSKKVVSIWTDAPIKLNLEEVDGHKMDVAKLHDLLQNLEFKSLLNKLPGNMQKDIPSTDTINGSTLNLPKNVLIDSNEALKSLKLPTSDKLFVHSRCAGRHGKDPQVLMLSTDGKTMYTIDLTKIDKKHLVESLSKAPALAGYDVKSSLKVLKELGITDLPEVGHDILVAGFLINPLMRSQTLTDLATVGLNYDGASFEDLPTEDIIARSPEFIAVIRELYEVQAKELAELPKVAKLAKEIEWPLTPVLADMEYTGIKLNTDYLKKFTKEIEGMISDLEQSIYGHADKEFNIGSPIQLAEVLFTGLNLPTRASELAKAHKTDGAWAIKKGKTGFSTAASELDKLRGLHPIIDLITQYREVVKLKNTYVDTLPKLVDENSRVHTTFNLTVAQTGRLSSADPNLQNIPVRTELGKRIRTAFEADKGNVFISADYSQFELRLAAAITGEKSMLDAFNKDTDIHVETAAAVYDIPLDKVTKQMRYQAKAVNFGIMYGQGPHALSMQTGMNFADAKAFIEKYFQIRPKLKKFIEDTRALAEKQGYIENLLGRRRPAPDIKSSNFAVREAAYRAAVNMPLQGTAADIMKLVMIKVAEKLPSDAEMLLQIHDSILVEAPKNKEQEVGKILKETMENVYKLPVKLKADISTGKNWGEL